MGMVRFKCKQLLPCHNRINYMLLCAWKEKCFLLYPTQMRLPPHFVQVYIKASFDLLDWRNPVWISVPGQIFYMRFFFSFSCRHLQTYYSAVLTEENFPLHTRFAVLNCSLWREQRLLKTQAPWLATFIYIATGLAPASLFRGLFFLDPCGEGVEGNLEDTFLNSVSVLSTFPLLALTSHPPCAHCRKLFVQWSLNGESPHVYAVYLTIALWAIPWGKMKGREGEGRYFLWFRFCLY